MADLSRYKNGKVYKLVSDVSPLIYIGSTCKTLSTRLSCHKSAYKENGKRQAISRQLFELGGNVSIILIEEINCENKQQLLRRERHFIETMDCINKVIPIREPGETNTLYYYANIEVCKAKNMERHYNNMATNPEYVNKRHEQAKAYREKTKDVKITCECGTITTPKHLARHKKTQKHLELLI
jgi:hypothetical protein